MRHGLAEAPAKRQAGLLHPGLAAPALEGARPQTGTTFAVRWTASGPNDHSTNERTYRRVQAGAQLLEHVPDKRVKAAAQVGQFAGQFGPEAEKVVGPAARRTAYRYRGTERMPDKQLITYREQALTTTAKPRRP